MTSQDHGAALPQEVPLVPEAGAPGSDAGSETEGRGIRAVATSVLARLILAPEISLIIALIVFGAIVQAQNPVFVRYENLILVAKAAGPVFIVSVTMTFVLVGGGIDLSVGSVAALGGVVTALALKAGVPIPIAILEGLGVQWLFLGTDQDLKHYGQLAREAILRYHSAESQPTGEKDQESGVSILSAS